MTKTNKTILAIVGMPGSGKTEVVEYLHKKGIPFIRFGQFTDEGIAKMGLPLTPDNERIYREKIRRELGMAAYAVMAKSKIEEELKRNNLIVIDGLYSWEEYTFLKEQFPHLTLVHVYAEPSIRYKRLAQRPIRQLPLKKGRERDIAELEGINKGGPIAIADYVIGNNGTPQELHEKIDALLQRLGIG